MTPGFAKNIIDPMRIEGWLAADNGAVKSVPLGDRYLYEVRLPVAEDFATSACFAAFAGLLRVFWRGKGESVVRVGIDAILSFKTVTEAQDLLAALALPLRCYGGLAFDLRAATSSGGIPQSSGAFAGIPAQFFVPKWEFICPEGQRGSCALRFMHDRPHLVGADLAIEISKQLQSLAAIYRAPIALPQDQVSAIQRRHQPDFADWCRAVDAIHQGIEAGTLVKAVLSRFHEAWCAEQLCPGWFLDHLLPWQDASYLFAFGIPDNGVFLGCSPERVLSWRDREIFADAIAGTRPRLGDGFADSSQGKELKESAKELAEHRNVSDFVEETLAQACSGVHKYQSEALLKLKYVQHMISSYSGKLLPGTSPTELLLRLHPTPAVAGLPRSAAMDLLAASEGFCRGWFAGSVGWLSPAEGDFAIGIRSAWLKGQLLRVYAGAGIVAGSQAKAEWHETEAKMANFLRLLASEPPLVHSHSKAVTQPQI